MAQSKTVVALAATEFVLQRIAHGIASTCAFLALTLMLGWPATSWAKPNDPVAISGLTNRDGGDGCIPCHGSTGGQISVTLTGDGTLTRGQSATYTVKGSLVSNTSGKKMGVAIAAQDSGATISGSAPLQYLSGSRELIHNSDNGTLASTNASGEATYTFTYTMPSNAAFGSTHKLYAVARIHNGASNANEWAHAADKTVTTITPAPTINSASTKTGKVGVSLSYQIGVTSGSTIQAPTSYNATGRPDGISVNTSTGLLSGTPTNATNGTPVNTTLSATNSGGTDSQGLAFTISRGDQTLSFPSQSSVTYFPNGTFVLNAADTDPDAAPSPVYTSTTLDKCTMVSSSGTTVNIEAAGTCTILASQPGNSNWNPAPFVSTHSRNITINKATQTLSFGLQSPKTFVLNGTFNLSPPAYASSGLPPVTESLTPDICSVSGNTVTMLEIGTCTIEASRPGDGNYYPATPATISQDIAITAVPGIPLHDPDYPSYAGDGRAIVMFSAPTNPASIIRYTATCTNAGNSFSANATVGPVVVTGLTNGLVYNCKVTATNSSGTGPSSVGVNITPTASNLAPRIVSDSGKFPINLSVGTAKSYFVVSRGNPFPTYSIVAGALPSGMSLVTNSRAPWGISISGTPVNGTVGTHTITMRATNSYGPRFFETTYTDDEVFTITVAKGNQTITFPTIADKTFSATPFAITLPSASSLLSVTVTSSTSTICTYAGGNVTMKAVGTCTLTATQAGSANYFAATPVVRSFEIALAPQTITFNAQTTATRTFSPGATFAISPLATTTSPLGIAYDSRSPSVCTVSGTTVTMVGAGTCILEASQDGNALYAPAADATQNVLLNQASQSINFPVQSNQAFVEGGSFAISPLATASSALVVSYASTTPAVCVVSDTSVAIMGAGTCSIQATQAGDANFIAAAPVVRSLNIQAVPPGAPTLDVAIPSDSKIVLSVVPPVFTGGAPLTGFSATCNPGGITATAVNSPLTVSGLTNGVAYSCSVVAQNVAGDSAPSNSIGGITPFLDTGANLWAGKCSVCHGEVPTGNRFNAAGTTGTVINYVRSAQAEMLATSSVQALSLNELAEIAKYVGTQLTPITANTAYATSVDVDVGQPKHLYLGGVAFDSAQVVTAPVNGVLSVFSGTTITYTPNVGFTGTDSFTYRGRRTSPALLGDTFTVTINVATPSAPVITSGTTGNGVFGQAFNYQITATNSPASFGASGLGAGVSVDPVTGVISGVPTVAGVFNVTVSATNPGGTGSQGVQITISPAGQSIAFGAQTSPRTFGGGVFPIAAGTASSGLPVSYSSLTPAVCTVAGTNVTPVSAGTCTIAANQAGSGNYNAALQVTQDVTISASLPDAPTIGAAVGGVNQASISFTPPANTGGSPVTLYTATCNTGGFSGSNATSPVVVSGLTNNTQYSCTVTATNAAGTGAASGPVLVTPTAANVAPNITSASATIFTVLSAGNFTVTASGNPAPTLSQTGTLPAGVTFNTGSGVLSGTPSTGTAGNYPLTFTAAGTLPNANQSFTLTIAKANQTINFANPGTKNFSIVPFALAATASSGLGLSYTSNTPGVCTVAGSNVTTVATGVCSISADQAGNVDYNAAPQVTQGFSVSAGAQSITFGAQTSPRNFSTTPFALSPVAFATSGLAIAYSTTTPAVCVMSGNNVATLSAGTCTIAANQAGNANYAAAPQATQSLTVNAIAPAAPTIGTATGSDQQATIGFTPPASNGGAVLSYTATCAASGQTTRTGTGSTSPIMVGSLVNGIVYSCTVTATNSAGTSAASGAVQVTPTSANGEALWASVCAACHLAIPSGNQLNGAGSTAAVLSFVRSLQPVMQFNVNVQALNASELASIAAYINNNLVPNQVTTAQNVPAQIDVSGHVTFTNLPWSAFSAVEVVTPPANGTVSAFTGRTATYTPNPGFSGTDTFTYRGKRSSPNVDGDPVQVTVNVTAGAPTINSAGTANGNFGQAFSYQITGTGSPASFGASGLPSGLSVDNVTGLISGAAGAGGTFNATVTATNAGGTGMAPLVITIAPAAQSIAFNAQSPSSQTFVTGGTFPVNPLATGGASGNAVTYASNSPAVCTVSGTTVTMVFGGTCTIVANQAGNNDYAAAAPVTASVTIAPVVPGIPGIGAATPGNTQAQIAFTAPTSSGGGAILDYTATCTTAGQTTRIGTGALSPISVTGLVNAVSYVCSVTARNSAGSGAASSSVSVTPIAVTVPGAPSIGLPVEGDGNVVIAFNAPADNGGAAITAYTVTCNPGNVTVGGAGSPITVTGLTNGVAYTCSVTATNSAGTGPASSTVQVTPESAIAFTGGVVSRKLHGAAGTFPLTIDSAVPITGAVTVEPRAVGPGHVIVFSFTAPVTGPGTATVVDALGAPAGTASTAAVGNTVEVTLAGVDDNRRVTVQLTGVNGSATAAASIGFLVGDINGSGRVTGTDISAVKARSGAVLSVGNNFLFDLNLNGTISITDVSAAKARAGRVLP